MIRSQRTALKAIAVLLVLAVVQLYLPMALAQQFIARLTSTKGGPILVNGNSTPVPGSITTGAEIQTGIDQTATIDLGDIGELKMGPNTRLKLDYDDNGAKVTLFSGCAILTTKENKEGEVATPQESAGKNDKKGGILDICFINGNVTKNTAAKAIAEVGTLGGAGGAGGLSQAAWWAIILVPIGGVVTWLLVRNPSP